MTESEKDSLLVRAAEALLRKGWLVAIAAGQLLLSAGLRWLGGAAQKEWLPSLFLASSILWLALSVLGVVLIRRLSRENRALKRGRKMFSEDEWLRRAKEMAAEASYNCRQ